MKKSTYFVTSKMQFRLNLPNTIVIFLMLLFTQSLSFGQPITISADETWGTGGNTPTAGYEEGIIIAPGVTLTINNTGLLMNNDKTIILQSSGGSGSHLIMNNSNIATFNGGTTTWVGIEANGDVNLDQYYTVPSEATPYTVAKWEGVLESTQTSVILKNSAISNAEIGILSIDGAIVRTRASNFYNCETGIKIDPYLSPSTPEINACYCMDTRFEWNQYMSGFTQSLLKGIWLNEVRGIHIGGCTFINLENNLYCKMDRGTGIYAFKSDFGAQKSGNILCTPSGDEPCEFNCYDSPGNGTSAGNVFEQLSRGIDFIGDPTGENRFVIKNSTFTNNYQSVVHLSSYQSAIYLNSFSAIRPSINGLFETTSSSAPCNLTASVGNELTHVLSVDGSRMRIISNEFEFDDDYAICVDIYNTITPSGTSRIKENNFTCTTSGFISQLYGVRIDGDNSNLQIFCNIFDEMGYDINVSPTGLLLDQLSFTNPTRWTNNTHSTQITSRTNVVNTSSNSFIYYYEAPNTPSHTNPLVLATPGDIAPSCTITCDELYEETIGLIDLKTSVNFRIFPNPASSKVHFQVPDQYLNAYINVEIFDANGKVVLNLGLGRGLLGSIDVSDLDQGFYLAKMSIPLKGTSGFSKFCIIR